MALSVGLLAFWGEAFQDNKFFLLAEDFSGMLSPLQLIIPNPVYIHRLFFLARLWRA